MSISATDGVASTTRTTFSRSTRIAQHIGADAAAVWRLLATAEEYPTWSSTTVSLEGQIVLGSTIKLVSTLDPTRTFKLKVTEFEPNTRLTFANAMFARTCSLSSGAEGTRVEIVERIGGPLYPLVARRIPPLERNFERFTADLKKAAEGTTGGHARG
ncbi:SRPBCC family protein [Microbacterium hibisci]|uniref:SRPBCC family protein n=1 Tax=Microbacterium hibisci TaxID=2036000 RepID=UPI0019406E66|nr:SRPBCC family protein [Microbacterium hibisci]